MNLLTLQHIMKTVTDLPADGAATAESKVSQRFLELLAARAFDSLPQTLASDATARFLLPHGLEEYAGGDAIIGRIRSWFESASAFELTSSSEEPVAASIAWLNGARSTTDAGTGGGSGG